MHVLPAASVEHSVAEATGCDYMQELTVIPSKAANAEDEWRKEAKEGRKGKNEGTSEMDEEKAMKDGKKTPEPPSNQRSKRKATASAPSNRSRHRRLPTAVALSGWKRKTCEGIVLSIAVVISLCIGSVPAVLYSVLTVRTCIVKFDTQKKF